MGYWSESTPCPNCGKKRGLRIRCNNCGTLGCQFCLGSADSGPCKECKKSGEKVKV